MRADTGASASARSSMSSLVPPPARRAMPPRNDVKLAHCRTQGHRVVLLVDDDIGVLEGLKRALRREGLDVLCATSARGALEILRATRVEVVVSDDCMPGMSGSALLAAVREMLPSVARIILTGGGTLDAAARAISDGVAFAFLTKPCEATALASLIHDALSFSATTSTRRSPLNDGHRCPAEVLFQALVSAAEARRRT